MTGIGFFALVEIYAADNVLGKAGGFLATASLFCFASLVLSISHRVIVGFKVYRAWHTGTYYFETPMKLELIVSYPLGWLFVPALIAGICLLAAGIMLRAHSERNLF